MKKLLFASAGFLVGMRVLAGLPVEWPMDVLSRTPQVYPATEYETNGVEVAFLEGLPWDGSPTRIFCYYGVPAHGEGEKVPGMVLVHGGGGSAFYRWVKFWNERGYAAISMDTCGAVSGNTIGSEQRKHFRHPQGGPPGWGGFQNPDAGKDHWMYHAVADAIIANSFLRSLEGVDQERIGITGVSWGGVVSCIVASQDGRLRFAAPVYGCGDFLEDADGWCGVVKDVGTEKLKVWQALWDPIRYLPFAKMPVHWLAGSNDSAFSIPALVRSYDAVEGDKTLSIKVGLDHAHGAVSENARELTVWADFHLKGIPLPKPVRAELNYTVDRDENWKERRWRTIPARLENGRPAGPVPDGASAFYFNTVASDGFVLSTPVETRRVAAKLLVPGRQLLVDDDLIESTDLKREFHLPVKYEGNPVLRPETRLERSGGGDRNATARPVGGGIWWDPHRKTFRYWYEAGFLRTVAYAETTNGVDFVRPDLWDGTNQVLPSDLRPDSWEVLPDFRQKDPYSNWVMYLRGPGGILAGFLLDSKDGLHWEEGGRHLTGPSGDRSNLYYDPFRRAWVFALRSWNENDGRTVSYHESPDLSSGMEWTFDPERATPTVTPWLKADEKDLPDPEIGRKAQLYAFNAVAYESLMLGAFEVHRGPENRPCAAAGMPKITDVCIGYSRDGKKWIRPDRRPFIASERWKSGKWDAGYVQVVGNLCVVMGDELWFYYGAFAGDPARRSVEGHNFPYNGMYHNAATGIAKLRRDGFASMKADSDGGVLLTKPFVCDGNRLFANLRAKNGSVKVETIPESVIVELKDVDSVKMSICDTSSLCGKAIRLKFTLRNAEIFSFWIAEDERGRSGGYLGGGGPGYSGVIDR